MKTKISKIQEGLFLNQAGLEYAISMILAEGGLQGLSGEIEYLAIKTMLKERIRRGY